MHPYRSNTFQRTTCSLPMARLCMGNLANTGHSATRPRIAWHGPRDDWRWLPFVPCGHYSLQHCGRERAGGMNTAVARDAKIGIRNNLHKWFAGVRRAANEESTNGDGTEIFSKHGHPHGRAHFAGHGKGTAAGNVLAQARLPGVDGAAILVATTSLFLQPRT